MLKDIDKEWEAIEAAADAAYDCIRTYNEDLKTSDLNHRLAMAQAANRAKDIFWECMGFGAAAGTTTGGWLVRSVRGATVTVGRIGAGAAGFVVGIATYKICKDTRDDTAQSYIDVANQAKAHADSVALRKRDACRETTNYERVKRAYENWWFRRASGKGYLPGGYRRAINGANADHAKCLAHFTYGDYGDCGTTD